MRPQKTVASAIVAILAIAAPCSADRPRAFARAEADLAAATGGLARVVADRATSRARLIEFDPGSLHLAGATFREKSDRFFALYGELFGVRDASHDLEMVRTFEDRYGTSHLVFHQTYNGLPVFGAEIRVHFDGAGELTTITGKVVPDLDLGTTPVVPRMHAQRTARTVAAKEHHLPAHDFDSSEPELMVYRSGLIRGIPGSNHLVWKLDVSHAENLRETFFIDAHSGDVVDRIDQIHTITRRVYHRNTGNLLWNEGDPIPFAGLTSAKDQEVNELISTAEETYDLYANITGGQYLSYSGNDAPMRSVYEADGLDCPNATWNGMTTNFCSGLAVDDVIAHEWTHGYTQFNHDLVYKWQPGALNESYSDIFGEIVDDLNGRGLDDPSSLRSSSGCSTFGGSNPPTLEVVSPASLAGSYSAGFAEWNPQEWSANGIVELVSDGTDTVTDACEPLVSFTTGRIALIDRGSCTFVTKVLNAQDAGAVAVIVANNVDDSLVIMGGSDPNLEIPALSVGLTDGETFKSAVVQGLEVAMGMDVPSDASVRWLVAEDANGGAIRDMWNPGCFYNPGSVSSARYWCDADDSGGVHINSGIPNHVFALLVDGGTLNDRIISPIGMTKAAHIYWRSMDVYQGPATGFAEHADMLELSCQDLVGQPITSLTTGATIGDTVDTFDCQQVAAATTAVDMRAEPPCIFELILDPNPPDLPDGDVVFSETFSNGPGAGWDVSSEGVYPEYDEARSAWRWTTNVPDGGDGGAYWAINSVLIGNCEPNDDDQSGVTRLESPPIEIPPSASGATLSFDHWVYTEDGWDGGNLRISVNDGAYQVVPPEAFIFNPYNSSVIDSMIIEEELVENTNPLAGETAFTGEDEGHVFGGSWGQSQIDLDFFAQPGDTVRIRWDFGIDGCNGREGWYVDNVRVIAEETTPLSVRRTSGRRTMPAGLP